MSERESRAESVTRVRLRLVHDELRARADGGILKAKLSKAFVALLIFSCLLGGFGRAARMTRLAAPASWSHLERSLATYGAGMLGGVLAFLVMQVIFFMITRQRTNVITWARRSLDECAQAWQESRRKRP